MLVELVRVGLLQSQCHLFQMTMEMWPSLLYYKYLVVEVLVYQVSGGA